MAQLMPLPLTVSCSSKIQIGFTFLVPAYPGCPGKEAVRWLLFHAKVTLNGEQKRQPPECNVRCVKHVEKVHQSQLKSMVKQSRIHIRS